MKADVSALLDFEPDHRDGLIGEGSFGRVYRVGNEAIKRFKRPDETMPDDPQRWDGIVKGIMRNLHDKYDFFVRHPFVPLVRRPKPHARHYAMVYSDCSTAEYLVRENLLHDPSRASAILLTYGAMLDYLHHNKLLFVDNSLSAILVQDDWIRICDYDLVSSVREINTPGHFARECGHLAYASRDQIWVGRRMTVESEVESYALIVTHVLAGRNLLEGKLVDDYQIDVIEEKRDFPDELRRLLPPLVAEAVVPVLHRKRDYKITLADIMESVRRSLLPGSV